MRQPDADPVDEDGPRVAEPLDELGAVIVAGDRLDGLGVETGHIGEEVDDEALGVVAEVEDRRNAGRLEPGHECPRQPPAEARQVGVGHEADHGRASEARQGTGFGHRGTLRCRHEDHRRSDRPPDRALHQRPVPLRGPQAPQRRLHRDPHRHRPDRHRRDVRRLFLPEAVPAIVDFFKPILVGQGVDNIAELWRRMYHCGNFWAASASARSC